MEPIIKVDNIHKTYGGKNPVKALDGVSLEVQPGTVVGLLGPNGAGKTTLVKVLTTLLEPDSGTATIAGIDVKKDPDGIRRTIGLAGQYAAIDESLTGRENIELVGRLYHMPRKEAQKRAAELLEEFELSDAADRTAKTYSGGMRRRLDLAASLVFNPKVLFLDEPTTGLDPRSRIGLWAIIKKLVKGGTTLLLTTQYLEEADQLANVIVVIDHGKVIARGTANELKSRVGGDMLELHVADESRAKDAAQAIMPLTSVGHQIDIEMDRVTMPVADGATVLADAIRKLDAANVEIANINLRRPTLDDVFLALTGHSAEQKEVAAAMKKQIATNGKE